MPALQRILDLLNPAERRAAVRVLLLMCVGVVLETLGIGLVVPVLTLVTSPVEARGPVAAQIAAWLGATDANSLAVAAVAALFVVYLLKNAFLSLLAWAQYAFTAEVQQQLSRRLYRAYLDQPYAFHLGRNSAELIRNITIEVNLLTHSLNGIMQLTTELLVASAVIVLLVWFEPRGALLLFACFGFAGYAFFAFSRQRALRWGRDRQHHEGLRIKHLQQGFGGIKETLLSGCQARVVDQFQVHNVFSSRAARYQNTLQQMPRLWLETLSMLGLAIVVAVSVGGGREVADLIPTLGIFAAAAFRMIPSVNRLLVSIQAVRFGAAAVTKLHDEMRLLASSRVEAVSSSSAPVQPLQTDIAFRQVTYRYAGAAGLALDAVSLRVARGEVVGVIGASGSGKSTLIDLMLGLLEPVSGAVLVDGGDIRDDLPGWRRRVGYVPQSIYLSDDTLRRNIAFGQADEALDEAAVQAAVDAAQLRTFVAGLPDGLDTVVGERGVRLSGGQRQRIGIARALYHNPSVLVLDEATSALDGETEEAVMDAVNALRGTKTIIIVAHRLSTVSRCDRIFRLAAGRIVAEGTPQSVLGAVAVESA
jgi:ABC-type multidrug transport system fused ATPase/permease subunit